MSGTPASPGDGLAVVVIGRNEGERLRRCLRSLVGRAPVVVYVDSGSDDGSPELARSLGVDVVCLDDSKPFTAARARNAGVERLNETAPDAAFVQFVDGDSELAPGWLEAASSELQCRPEVAIVTGRLRERHPEASVYNWLCNIEWETPIGELRECGGICMMRLAALKATGGYNSSLPSHEEPELCVRLRRRGWTIRGIADDMGWHDAAMTRFGQWWKRAVRCGHGYAEGAMLHGWSSERCWLRETFSAAFWGGALPIAALVLAWPTRGVSVGVLAAYPLQWWRIRSRRKQVSSNGEYAGTYSFFVLLAKQAQFVGLLRYGLKRVFGSRS